MLKKFFILQTDKINRFLSLFRKNNWAQIAVIFGSLLIFAGLSLAVFLFSLNSFLFLAQYPETSQPIIIYSLAVTFILSFLLVFVSAIVASLGGLFQREDNILLFSLPIETAIIFESRLIDIIILSSWPIFIFAVPLVFGFSKAFKMSLTSSFVFLAGLLFLTVFANLLGIVSSLLISQFARIGKKSKILRIAALISLPLIAGALIKFLLPNQLLDNLESLTVEQITWLLRHQTLMAKYLPTTWLVEVIFYWDKNLSPVLAGFFRLTFSILVISFLTSQLRKKFYLRSVSQTMEGRFIAGPQDITPGKYRSFPYILKGKMGALTEKDWLLIFRSPGQFFQLLFIVFLQILYFLIISRLPVNRIGYLFPFWYKNQLVALNLLFANYLASILAMRFFFPMISLEGQSSWIVWSSPLPRIKLFWQKFISSFLLLLAWLTTSTFFAAAVFKIAFFSQWQLFLINLPVSLTITAITLGMGAIKPNFWEKNPEKLSTNPGGILATTVCLVYNGLISLVLFYQKDLFSPARQLFIWSVSLLIILPIFYQVAKRINKYQI
ncbi:MAG TPA: hypothetical protein VMW41_01990 [Candidatus Bathyarchaeia archaeon]|nr:hypothetical protein [Candidatus Bathyarchaeia archaeon]